MSKNNKIIVLIIAVIAILIIGATVYSSMNNDSQTAAEEPQETSVDVSSDVDLNVNDTDQDNAAHDSHEHCLHD